MYFRRNHYILNHSASSILLEIIYCAHAHTHIHVSSLLWFCLLKCWAQRFALGGPRQGRTPFHKQRFSFMATRPLLHASHGERSKSDMGVASEISGVETQWHSPTMLAVSSSCRFAQPKACFLDGGGNSRSPTLLSKKFFFFNICQEQCFVFQFSFVLLSVTFCCMST